MLYFLDLLGTFAFAVSGATKARGRELNIFGVVFLGAITAVGGGTIRDLIIGRTPLFYLIDRNYLLIVLLGAITTYLIPSFFKKQFSFFRFLDSVGLATFIIIGASVSLRYLYDDFSIISALAAISLGVLTASGGGILRDAVLGDTPFALKNGSNYITAAFLGSTCFYGFRFISLSLAVSASFIAVLLLREVFSQYGIYRKLIKK